MSDDNAPRIKVTPVFQKLDIALRSNKYRVIALQGGTRSSKTYSILQRLCIECFDTPYPLRIAICSRRFTWCMRNVFPQFKHILQNDFKCWNDAFWHGTNYTYNLNGSEILFIGLEGEAGKRQAHGLETDICFINEANFIDQSIYYQLLQRNKKLMIVDFNPGFDKRHWIVQSVIPHPECFFMRSTYKDNPFLSEQIVKTIEGYEPTPENIALGTADEQLWKIYGLGELATIKGLIYPRWVEVKAKDFPDKNEFERYGYGLDFGFSNDPSALVFGGIKDGCLYLKEIFYETELTSIINPNAPEQRSIEELFIQNKINKQDLIVADSARPEMIQDLKNCGYNIIPCKKGHGSILEGINYVKMYKLRVHEDSYNLQMELNNYKWKIKNDDTQLPEPHDSFNHCFVAGTKITTNYGYINIEDLTGKELVLTRQGYKKIDWVFPTRNVQEIYELTTESGIKLYGTKDHKIFTPEGKVELQYLKGKYIYKEEQSCVKKPLYTMDIHGIDIQNQRIFQIEDILSTLSQNVQNIYIGIYGKNIMETSLKGMIYIIKTGIQVITILKTLLCYQKKNMLIYTLLKIEKKCYNILMKLETLQKNGMLPKKGTNGMLSNGKRVLKRYSSLLLRYVKCVEKNIQDMQNLIMRNFVPITVNQLMQENLESIEKQEYVAFVERNLTLTNTLKKQHVQQSAQLNLEKVIRIRKINKPAIVYNLQVNDCHEYFANGILVSNCLDGTRYLVATHLKPYKMLSARYDMKLRMRTGIEKYDAF